MNGAVKAASPAIRMTAAASFCLFVMFTVFLNSFCFAPEHADDAY